MKDLIMKEKYNAILSDFNYKIKDIFDRYEVKFYDMNLFENNIEIFCAILVSYDIEENLIIDIIIEYIDCFADILNDEEIKKTINKIKNNIIYINKKILRNNSINPLNELSKITIENCVDKPKVKNSPYLMIEIAIIIKYVMIDIINLK